MKIVMIGQKGIPAHSGGIQQHVEALSHLLIRRGHEVVVYCRRSYCGRDARSSSDNGLHRIVRPSIPTKHFDAITHSLTGTIDVMVRRADVVHYHAIGPAALAPLSRLARLPVVVTVHGLDWQRAKWGRISRQCLRMGELIATKAANRMIVVSPVLKDYFDREHNTSTEFIPNGVMQMERRRPQKMLEFGIQPKSYIFAAGRFVPEKGFHYLIEAFQQMPHDMKLVIAGSGAFDMEYERQLRRATDPRIVFTGPADRELMAELFSHASLFVMPSDLEGMPIVLLEAMHMGVPILASDIDVNRCVVGDSAALFRAGDVESLRTELTAMLDDSDLQAKWSPKVIQRAKPYNWTSAVERVEQVYQECASGKPNSEEGSRSPTHKGAAKNSRQLTQEVAT